MSGLRDSFPTVPRPITNGTGTFYQATLSSPAGRAPPSRARLAGQQATLRPSRRPLLPQQRRTARGRRSARQWVGVDHYAPPGQEPTGIGQPTCANSVRSATGTRRLGSDDRAFVVDLPSSPRRRTRQPTPSPPRRSADQHLLDLITGRVVCGPHARPP